MAENIQKTNGVAKNYQYDRGGMTADFGPFVGVIKNNVDPTRQGRVQVFIEQFAGTDPENPSLWRTVSYCPSFYGATPQQPGTAGDTDAVGGYIGGNPQSYGMWFTPPDLGGRLLCFFAGGDPSLGYYLGCIPDAGMTHMIPAVGASAKFDLQNSDQKSYYAGAKVLPVTEINPNNSKIDNSPKFFDQPKPVHSFVAASMFQQGTLADAQRGPISSTSQRESPSACFGLSTPGRAIYQGGISENDVQARIAAGSITAADAKVVGRRGGHSIVLDDGDLAGKDKLIRIRTGSGHQITMSDDGNFLYIVHANGQSWIELGQEGTMDVYATNSINLRTQGTLNLHADQDINMFAGNSINMKSVVSTTIETERALVLNAGQEVTLYGQSRIGVLTDGSLALVSASGSWDAGAVMSLQAAGIDLNGGGTLGVQAPEPLTKYVMPDTEFDNATGWTVSPTGIESIVTRAPCHEPWPFHNKGVGVDVAMEIGQPTPPPAAAVIPTGWSGAVSLVPGASSILRTATSAISTARSVVSTARSFFGF
jgi:hypothetical protein